MQSYCVARYSPLDGALPGALVPVYLPGAVKSWLSADTTCCHPDSLRPTPCASCLTDGCVWSLHMRHAGLLVGRVPQHMGDGAHVRMAKEAATSAMKFRQATLYECTASASRVCPTRRRPPMHTTGVLLQPYAALLHCAYDSMHINCSNRSHNS